MENTKSNKVAKFPLTISYLSNRPYIGNIGSGSVSGYWTVWTVRINGWNQMISQPKPRKINQRLEDLAKFRGILWADNPIGFDGDVIPVQVRYCENCEEYRFFFDGTLWVDNPIGSDGDVIPVQVRYCGDCEEYQLCEVCKDPSWDREEA